MGIQVNIGEAKTRLSELVAASLRGEEVILSRAGVPVIRFEALDEGKDEERRRLVAKRSAMMKAALGSMRGKFSSRAVDLIAEPSFTDEEIESFSAGLGD